MITPKLNELFTLDYTQAMLFPHPDDPEDRERYDDFTYRHRLKKGEAMTLLLELAQEAEATRSKKSRRLGAKHQRLRSESHL